MLTRLVIVLGCAGVVVLLAATLRGHDRCQEARAVVFGAATGRLPAADADRAGLVVGSACRGTDGLVAASAALHGAGRDRAALALAARAAAREPQSATVWDAMAAAARRVDGGIARCAGARAERLSPLRPVPAPAPRAAGGRASGEGP